ncbi:MAG: DHA2 family efflux MFS transporter permease subunit [Thermoleophilaceae bacterium]|nr:DHA2 family efflux MFS transporter permease subunit [Thermoleophilaceae bacterium]
MTKRAGWTLALAGAGLFMTALDNLVVGVALPSIRADLGGSIESLEWTVNAYTLAFAVLLITGAALGDRFGRKRMFIAGMGLFTFASALAALSPSIEALIAARALQGVGAAIVTPLTLTLVSEAFPPDRRAAALGIWGGISGLGVALGPFVGGAVVEGIAWQWVFWINVPIGLVLIPLAVKMLSESHGPDRELDLRGLALAGAGLFGLTFGIVRGEALGWTSPIVVGSLGLGVAVLAAFVAHERSSRAPMLPLRFFRSRAFSATNGLSFAMFFGTFGAIFLLSQFFQTAQGLGPFEAGLRTLPWTGMPMLVAPLAGLLMARVGTRPLMAAGLALQAVGLGWVALVAAPGTPFVDLIPPFVLAGTGMALVFPTAAETVLASVRRSEAGKASGANNAVREIGGVMGVAVLASVFTANGGYSSPQAFTDGVVAALPVAVVVLTVGAVLALLVPGRGQVAPPIEATSVGKHVPSPAA